MVSLSLGPDTTDDHVSAARPLALERLWQQLASGQWRVLGQFADTRRCYLTLAEVPADQQKTSAVRGRRLQVVETALSSSAQKEAAFELGRHQSTIASAVARATRSMGLRCRGSQLPLLVVMAACSTRLGTIGLEAQLSEHQTEDFHYYVASILRPDQALASVLTPAEHDTIRLLVDGVGRSKIAERRGTSERTVSNQLGSAFRKLKVSGRAQLVQRLVSLAACSTSSPPIERAWAASA